LTQINKQIVYRYSHFPVQTSKKHISFSCILVQLELLANVFLLIKNVGKIQKNVKNALKTRFYFKIKNVKNVFYINDITD